jgi:hypothetical protein
MAVKYLVDAYSGEARVRFWTDYAEAIRVFRQALNNLRIDRAEIWQDEQGDRIRLESFNAVTRFRHIMYRAQA